MITKLEARAVRARIFGRVMMCAAIALVCLVPLTSLCAADDQAKLKTDYALIVGTVWGADNRPVYGVRIIVRRADAKKGGYERTSDHNGEFAVRVPSAAADYVVRADVKTPKGQLQPEAKVHVDGNERVEVGLHLR